MLCALERKIGKVKQFSHNSEYHGAYDVLLDASEGGFIHPRVDWEYSISRIHDDLARLGSQSATVMQRSLLEGLHGGEDSE